MAALNITDLNNGQRDLAHIAEVATSKAATATDRLGNQKPTLLGAVSSLKAFTSRGAWATGANYAIRDLVQVGDTWYVCVEAHTSGPAFETDIALKWRVHQGLTAADLVTQKPFGASSTLASDIGGIYPGARASLADVIDKLHSGEDITIACYGDSLTYGQDTSVNGQATQINGSGVLRSRYPYPESLNDALSLNSFSASATVINRGYPGDTAAMGLDRWAGASATDVAILMYGTNDGKALAVPIIAFRKAMAAMIEREFDKGAVVVLMSPPLVNDPVVTANIAPYTGILRQLAEEYRLIIIDSKEQLSSLTTIWSEPSDLVHLNSQAYAEMGWHLAALFVNRDRGSRSFSAGSMYYPVDAIGYGGTRTNDTNAKGSELIALAPGERYVICGYFDSDVLPVIHSYNVSDLTVDLLAQYAGNGSGRGLIPAELVHVPSVAARQSLTANVLRKGYRTLALLNNGVQTAFIEAIEFAELSHVTTARGMLQKSSALTGIFQSARHSAALADWWTAIDYAHKLKAPYRFTAYMQQTGIGGLAIYANRQSQATLSDLLMVFRVDTDLYVRDIVGGVVSTTTYAGVFTAGVYTGEIDLEMTDTELHVYVDGALVATKAGPENKAGFPGFISSVTDASFVCFGAQVAGYIKGPY